MEEGAPGGGDREQQAGDKERHRADQHHGPQRSVAGLPRQRQDADDREGDPQEDQDVEDVVGQALHAHLDEPSRPHGEVAREGGRVVPGEDVEAGDRERVRDRLAGERVTVDDPVPGRPGSEHQQAHDGDHADQPQALDERRTGPADRQPGPHHRDPEGLVAGQRGGAHQQPQCQQSGVQEACAPRVTQHARHQQAGAHGEHPEQDRGIRLHRVEQEWQVDGGAQAGPDRQRPRAAGLHRALLGHICRKAPGQHAQERTEDRGDGLRCPQCGFQRDRCGRAGEGDRDREQQRGQGQPDLEGRTREHERWGAVAPERIGDQAPTLHEVAGDAHVVRAVLGFRERDRGGGDGAHHQRK